MNIFSAREFVPLYTAIAWIVFWAVLLIAARKYVIATFEAVTTRIRLGSSVTVGPVTIGEPPKDLRDTPNGSAAVSNTPDPEAIPAGLTSELIDQRYKLLIEQQYFLLHASEITKERTIPKSGRYRVRVWVESYFDVPLEEIVRVTYRIWTDAHHSIISSTSRNTNFDLWLSVYGEFPVLAYIELREKQGIWVTRYLDLPGRPPD